MKTRPTCFPISSQITTAIALPLLLAATTTASAKSPLGRNWPARQRVSMDQIDHAALDRLLHKYVDADGYVDYSHWQKTSADRKSLLAYLASLGRASTSLKASRQAKLAFWINAYNAVTIEGILQEYPTSSIRNHTARVFGYNIWKELPLIVAGKNYSLDDMEHTILRKMSEPRIHFAIVCASVGCPRLRNEAYTATNISAQLDDNAHDFFSRRQNLRVSGNTLFLSPILDWFGEDFGTTQTARLRTIKAYLPASTRQLVEKRSTQVRYLDYDWSLNDQSKKNAAARRR